MNKIVSIFFITFLIASFPCQAETGIVTKKITGCDYFIINAPTGYVVAEWYGGYEPFKGEKVIGAFQNYGMITLFYGVSNQDGPVWLEEWGLSYENALEIMSEKCN